MLKTLTEYFGQINDVKNDFGKDRNAEKHSTITNEENLFKLQR